MEQDKKRNEPIPFIMIEPDGFLPMRKSTMPKVLGRGRKRGSGCNMQFLKRMKVGDVAYPFSKSKKNSLRQTAHEMGIKVQFRQLPGTDNEYIIKRLS